MNAIISSFGQVLNFCAGLDGIVEKNVDFLVIAAWNYVDFLNTFIYQTAFSSVSDEHSTLYP